MPEIIKAYRQSLPPLRFVGKRYGDEDRVNGGFGHKWGEWFEKGWFAQLEQGYDLKSTYEDGDAYLGLMRWKEGEPFQYWIGVFLPAGAPAPGGYGTLDFPAQDIGVAWVYGKEAELYGKEEECAVRCEQEGMRIIADEQGAFWFFERYVCPRFTEPDSQGNVILDICHQVAREAGSQSPA